MSRYNNPSGDMEDTGQMQTDETLPSYHNQDKRNTKNTKQIILLVCGPFDAGDWCGGGKQCGKEPVGSQRLSE